MLQHTRIRRLPGISMLLFFFAFAGSASAQRQIITSYNDTNTLACNIKALLDTYHEELIHDHTLDTINPSNTFAQAYIHNAANFLPWHRYYIHKMEKYLHETYYYTNPEMFPLPYWSPFTRIPNPFFQHGPGPANLPICDRADDIPSGIHAMTLLPLQNQTITSNVNFTSNLNSIWGAQSPSTFYTNLYSASPTLCNYPTYKRLGRILGPGAGPHGRVHVAVGGALGGSFHEAPGASLFSIWHGYIDKIWHDWEGSCQGLTGADLYIPDRENDDDLTPSTKTGSNAFFNATIDSVGASHPGIDVGIEPNEAPGGYPMWVSDDIWVRNQDDGIQFQEHENPNYVSAAPVYVYVRVRNRGNATSSGNEELKLYWSKAGSGLGWSADWDGSNNVCGYPSGGQIGAAQSVTPLIAEGSKIYKFVWTPPNPNHYTCILGWDSWHFCLLARITDPTLPNDGMTTPETGDVYANTYNNNNIAWKNISVIYVSGLKPHGGFDHATVGIKAHPLTIKENLPTAIRLLVPYEVTPHQISTNILDFAKIEVTLDPELYEIWRAGGGKLTGLRETGDRVFQVMEPRASFDNLFLKEDATYSVNTAFTNLDKQPSEFHQVFKYDLVQTDYRRTIGGERFMVDFRPHDVKDPENPGKLAKLKVPEIKAAKNSISVMPNPTNGQLTILIRNKTNLKAGVVTIINASGKTVLNRSVSLVDGDNTFQLDLGSLPTGMYYAWLKSGNAIEKVKFIKE